MNDFNPNRIVMHSTAIKLRNLGFPQGKTPFLWHKQKGAKVSLPKFDVVAGEEHWKLYKRNKHDISAFGDSHGYNRWVSAPTYVEATAWVLCALMNRHEEKKEMLEDLGEFGR
jgi:hypothetical protein